MRVTEYDPSVNAFGIKAEGNADESAEINYRPGRVLDYESATYKPVAFELVMCASMYFPLSPEQGYDLTLIRSPSQGPASKRWSS